MYKYQKIFIFLIFFAGANLLYVPRMSYAMPIVWNSTEYKVSTRAEIDVKDSTNTVLLDWKDSTGVTEQSAPVYNEIIVDFTVGAGYRAGADIEGQVDSSLMKVLTDTYYSSPSGFSSKGWVEGNFKGTYSAESPLLTFDYSLEGSYNTRGSYDDLELYSWLKITNVTDDSTLYDRHFSYTDLLPGVINVYTDIGSQIAVDFGIGAYSHASSINNMSSAEFTMNYNARQGQASQVPEPNTIFLLGSLTTGLFGFAGLRRKFKNRMTGI